MKKLHVRTKIFFPKPYVVSVDHSDNDFTFATNDSLEFSRLKSRAYKLIKGTWGHSEPRVEQVSNDPPVNPYPKGSLAYHQWAFTQSYDMTFILRSYWCFSDELDALQFRLMVGTHAKRVYMWPEMFFTIHELIET